MIQQPKLAAFALLIGLAVVLLLAVMGDYASGGDYTVTRTTTIQSQRPIWLLVAEAGMGVLNDRTSGSFREVFHGSDVGTISSELRIDGTPAWHSGPSLAAAWKLFGFVVWDEAGRIERVTDLQFRGRSVRIVDTLNNGRVWVRVTVGPPLGDPRVKCAVLELEATEHGTRNICVGISGVGRRKATAIRLSCSAVIDLPADCRRAFAHRRLQSAGRDRALVSERVSQREAGPELAARVDGLATAGRSAVLAGRGQIDEIVNRFLERVCR